MKLKNISPMSFKGIYQLKSTSRSMTTKNVPTTNLNRGNEELFFANVTYRPFKDEVVDKKKIESGLPGVLINHYVETGDHYFASAVVPKITIGKALNCTQDEWERAHETKASSAKPSLTSCVSYDKFDAEVRK